MEKSGQWDPSTDRQITNKHMSIIFCGIFRVEISIMTTKLFQKLEKMGKQRKQKWETLRKCYVGVRHRTPQRIINVNIIKEKQKKEM